MSPLSTAPTLLFWASLESCLFEHWLSGSISSWVSLRGNHSFWQWEGNLTRRLQPGKKFALICAILLKDLTLQPFNCAWQRYSLPCTLRRFQKVLVDDHWLSYSTGTRREKENKRQCFSSTQVYPLLSMDKCLLAKEFTVCSLPSPKDPLHLAQLRAMFLPTFYSKHFCARLDELVLLRTKGC